MRLWKSLLATVLAVLLVLSMSVSAFAYTDVLSDNSYYPYINLVDSLGLIPANTMGDFNPKGYYTRGEALITAYRMINGGDDGLDDYMNDLGLFEDVTVDHPVLPYVNWAYDNSLITNELAERKFAPADPISGAEFLTLFVKVGNIDPNAAAVGGEGGEGGGDGAGTTTGELVYPDSYIELAYDFAGDVMGDEESITREMAAMTIAQLLWYQDSDTPIDMSSLEDPYGNRLDCFATNVYGLNKVNLVIRGTADRPMGYDFEGDVLLSNGSVMETEEDLSKYIGHPISVTYRDADRSGTLTEDEDIINYTVNAMMILEPALADITFDSYVEFTVISIGLSFKITNATKFYYNDQLWNQDEITNLISIAGGTGAAAKITNRPNMAFTVVPSEISNADTGDTMIHEIFVEEHRPAKIIESGNGAITLYDYYAAGTDAEYVQLSLDDVTFETSAAAPGDYVNYYKSGSDYFILDGSAVKGKITAIGAANELTLEDGTVLAPHQLFRRPNTMPKVGEELVIVTEDLTKTHYLAVEYAVAAEKTPAFITGVTEGVNSVTYSIFDCATGKNTTIEALYDNIYTSSKIEEGEFIYYSIDAAGNYSVVRANVSEKVHLGVEGPDKFVESETAKEYKKSPYYYGNLYHTDKFVADYYEMILDVSGNVLALR